MQRSEEELDNRRSPRVKTTPLRRPSDVKTKPSVSTNDSGSGSDSDPDGPAAADLASDASAPGRDESEESDEVPAALLQRAAMTHSSDEDADDDAASAAAARPTQVEKKCLIRMSRATPLSPKRVYRKRKLYSEANGRRAKARRVGSESSNDELKEGEENAGAVSPSAEVTGPRLADRQRGPPEDPPAAGAPTPKSDDQRTELPRKNRRPSSPSSSSTSRSEGEEAEPDPGGGSGSDSDDQRIKPITENVSLLGASGFQQSSGKSSSTVALERCCMSETVSMSGNHLLMVHQRSNASALVTCCDPNPDLSNINYVLSEGIL